MNEEGAFIEAINVAPEDDGPRLMYADWLEEKGDPRGEFIQTQCALRQHSTAALRQREHDIWICNDRKWSKPYREVISTHIANSQETEFLSNTWAPDCEDRIFWLRGFPSIIQYANRNKNALQQLLALPCNAVPIDRLDLCASSKEGLEDVAAQCAWISGLRICALRGRYLPQILQAIGRWPHLHTLECANPPPLPSNHFPVLQTLIVQNLDCIKHTPDFPRLESLHILEREDATAQRIIEDCLQNKAKMPNLRMLSVTGQSTLYLRQYLREFHIRLANVGVMLTVRK